MTVETEDHQLKRPMAEAYPDGGCARIVWDA